MSDRLQAEAFATELVKMAVPVSTGLALLARKAGLLPRYGIGAALGAGTGALAGAGTTPAQEEESAGRRALIGAGLGALAGLGGAKGVHWLGAGKPTGAERLGRMLHGQYYGMTGRVLGQGTMRPEQVAAKLKQLNLGPVAAAEALQKAKPGTNLKPLQARLEAAKSGLESLPGVLKGLVTSPGRTINTSWRALTPTAKVVTLGGVAFPIQELRKAKPEDYGPGKEFRSKKQHIISEAARNLGYIATGAAPVAPIMAAGSLLGEAGKAVGSLV